MKGRPQLPPQAGDEDFNRVRISIKALGVDMFRQFALRDHAIGVMHKVRQHAKFVAG